HGRSRATARWRYLRSSRCFASRHLACFARGRSEPARRAQAPWFPDPRLAGQGAQEGRLEEGPQAAAVLQALTSPMARLFGTDGVRGVAGELLSAELALALGKAGAGHAHAEHPRV